MTITWLPAPGVLQGPPRAQSQDRSPLVWTGAVTTHTYLPTKTLEDVVPSVRPQFEALLAHASSLGLSPKIRSAGRTCEEQAEQVKLGFSHADLCRSMHVLGHAVDLDLTPNTCESHTKLGTWWESRGGVWGGRWGQFGPCGDMGHYHYGFSGAGAVPTATCPSGVTLEQCQKLREEYLDRAHAAGPGVSSRSGLWAGLAIVAAGAAFVWAALNVKPGRLAVVRGNPLLVNPLRKDRIAAVASSIRNNIRDTIFELGGEPETVEGFQLAGWDSVESAVEAHHDGAFVTWLEYAPKRHKETWKLLRKFEQEWPAIKKATWA